MAGLTSIPFKPLISRPKSLSRSSIEPSLARLCVHIPNRAKSKSSVSASPSGGPITARYGAGRKYFPRTSTGGGNRRPRPGSSSEEEEEGSDREAADLSGIRSDTVRLIDQNQTMVGIVSKSEATQMAEDAGLDLAYVAERVLGLLNLYKPPMNSTSPYGHLVPLGTNIIYELFKHMIISTEADPPVVKIVDFSKYQYETQRKKRDQLKKTAGRRDQKELKMGYNIDVHDYTVRLKAAERFLKDGDKVKVIVNLKGRQNEFRKNATELLVRFKNDLGELAVEESRNFKERNLVMVFVPNKVVVQKDSPKKNEDSIVVNTEDSTIEVSVGEEPAEVLSGPFHMLKQES